MHKLQKDEADKRRDERSKNQLLLKRARCLKFKINNHCLEITDKEAILRMKNIRAKIFEGLSKEEIQRKRMDIRNDKSRKRRGSTKPNTTKKLMGKVVKPPKPLQIKNNSLEGLIAYKLNKNTTIMGKPGQDIADLKIKYGM